MTTFSETEAPPATACWRCSGKGYRAQKVKKTEVEKNATKGQHLVENVSCTNCNGTGLIQRNRTKKQRPFKQFEGWAEPGPDVPEANKTSLNLGQREELSSLLGKWKIVQNIDHHKYSTDDIVTAWVAFRVGKVMERHISSHCAARGAEPPRNLRFLDIGCGLGSVLLMTAWMHPTAPCVGIEAQDGRMSLAKRSVEYNGASSRVMVIHGDLRNVNVVRENASAILALHETFAGSGFEFPNASNSEASAAASPQSPTFDLITGTPPYFDVKQGGLPSDENSARCLFEYRGGIEAYCMAAKQYLAPHGLFVVCETALALERGYKAAEAAGLEVVARLDAKPKTDKAPLFIVYVMAHKSGPWTHPMQQWRRRRASAGPQNTRDNNEDDNGSNSSNRSSAGNSNSVTTAATDNANAYPAWELPADVFQVRSAQDQEDLPHPDMRTSEYAAALGVRLRDDSGKQEQQKGSISRPKQATRGLHVDFAGKPLARVMADENAAQQDVPGSDSDTQAGVKRARSSAEGKGEESTRGSEESAKPRSAGSVNDRLSAYHGLEVAHVIAVREVSNVRTAEYKTLLWEMGKPG